MKEAVSDRDKELRIMRDAHTLLINKQNLTDHNMALTQPALEQYINYTDVNDMINRVAEPIIDEIPSLRKALGE